MSLGRAIPHCPGPHKACFFQRELANLPFVQQLLEQQSSASSPHKASHIPRFPGNAAALQTLAGPWPPESFLSLHPDKLNC